MCWWTSALLVPGVHRSVGSQQSSGDSLHAFQGPYTLTGSTRSGLSLLGSLTAVETR